MKSEGLVTRRVSRKEQASPKALVVSKKVHAAVRLGAVKKGGKSGGYYAWRGRATGVSGEF